MALVEKVEQLGSPHSLPYGQLHHPSGREILSNAIVHSSAVLFFVASPGLLHLTYDIPRKYWQTPNSLQYEGLVLPN